MPEGFYFPRRENLWTPLQVVRVGTAGAAEAVQIFGRLADRVSDAQVRTELAL
jgi:hypothetical protein